MHRAKIAAFLAGGIVLFGCSEVSNSFQLPRVTFCCCPPHHRRSSEFFNQSNDSHLLSNRLGLQVNNPPSGRHRHTPLSSSLSHHDAASTTTTISSNSKKGMSDAALWHRQRRREMMLKYGDQIRPLERDAISLGYLAVLFGGNLMLLVLAVLCGLRRSTPLTFLLSLFPGSILSLWQLQILHDVLHGALLPKRLSGEKKQRLQDRIMFWGSLPCYFGYYLYLKFGHLTHHAHVGQADLKQVFGSTQRDFEDGDVLFVAHRMKLKGEVGPVIQLPNSKKEFPFSISNSGFSMWKEGATLRNMFMFASSFLVERVMLGINDIVVAVTGFNAFFPNKPRAFHQICTRYARVATILRLGLWRWTGWQSVLFLYLSESLWSIPPHPSSAMFVTNHGSRSSRDDDSSCEPSSSTYAGRWYSALTLGTNYHVEHHDFPTIPLHQLYKLSNEIAPEYYTNPGQGKKKDNIWSIMRRAFSHPDWYACSDVGVLLDQGNVEQMVG